jgi:hypothetical protein
VFSPAHEELCYCTVKATAPTVALTEPDVPVTVIVYAPGVVPLLPPPFPPPPLPTVPPPQAISPVVDTNRSRSPITATRSFRFGGLTKSNPNAKVVPLAKGQKRFLS